MVNRSGRRIRIRLLPGLCARRCSLCRREARAGCRRARRRHAAVECEMLQFGRKRFPPGARRVAVDYLRRRQALPDSLTALCDRRLRNQMQAIALIRLLDIRPKPRFKTHKSVRHELRRAAAPTSVLQAIKDIIQQENASALFISRCVLHSWRWRESNPRPNREPESFLHA